MNPVGETGTTLGIWVPRARGDQLLITLRTPDAQLPPPPGRGQTASVRRDRALKDGYPAGAGMHPSDRSQWNKVRKAAPPGRG